MRRLRASQCGATMIELLVAIIIGVITLTLITRYFNSQNRTYHSQITSAEMRQNVRAGMDQLTREVRAAGYDPDEIGFHGLVFNKDTLKILADHNEDGDLLDEDEQLQYYYAPSDRYIMRKEGPFVGTTKFKATSNEPVVEEVESFEFVFLTGTGDTVTSASDSSSIRKIALSIKMLSDARTGAVKDNDGKMSQDYHTLVSPRNLDL